MQEARPEAATKYGRLRGVLSEDGCTAIYRGIPYAAPPVGEYRWQPPREPESWQGVREASAFSNVCYHEPNGDPDWFYNREFRYLEHPQNESEDCLYLNIWAPARSADAPLPVAFWIHGGGFNNGYGHEPEFDGEAYARRGVILVTINYRLGVFGFFSHPDGFKGNYGLLDQLAALKWVRENIAAFGGDPDNITVFGQSAGGMSVELLRRSPLEKGMIARGIVQSGSMVSAVISDDFQAEALREADLLMDRAGVTTPRELCRMPAEELLRCWLEVKAALPTGGLYPLEAPRNDGVVISSSTQSPREMPILRGCTGNDGMGNPDRTKQGHSAVILCARQQKSAPTYLYYFDRELPGDSSGAFHSSELWYVFGTLRRS